MEWELDQQGASSLSAADASSKDEANSAGMILTTMKWHLLLLVCPQSVGRDVKTGKGARCPLSMVFEERCKMKTWNGDGGGQLVVWLLLEVLNLLGVT